MNEELEARLGAILSDPQQMEALRAMANSLMGGAAEAESTEQAPESGDGGLLARLKTLSGGGRASESEQLLRAMQPYMRPQRRTRIDRALKLTRLIGIAAAVMRQYGGELDGL